MASGGSVLPKGRSADNQNKTKAARWPSSAASQFNEPQTPMHGSGYSLAPTPLVAPSTAKPWTNVWSPVDAPVRSPPTKTASARALDPRRTKGAGPNDSDSDEDEPESRSLEDVVIEDAVINQKNLPVQRSRRFILYEEYTTFNLLCLTTIVLIVFCYVWNIVTIAALTKQISFDVHHYQLGSIIPAIVLLILSFTLGAYHLTRYFESARRDKALVMLPSLVFAALLIMPFIAMHSFIRNHHHDSGMSISHFKDDVFQQLSNIFVLFYIVSAITIPLCALAFIIHWDPEKASADVELTHSSTKEQQQSRELINAANASIRRTLDS